MLGKQAIKQLRRGSAQAKPPAPKTLMQPAPKAPLLQKPRLRQLLQLALPFVGIFVALALHQLLPNVYPANYSPRYWAPILLICTAIYALCYLLACALVPLRRRLLRLSWLLAAVFLLLEIYDIATLKTGTLKLPFIPSPDKVIEQFVVNFPQILQAASASLQLLATGFIIGLMLGLVSGVLCGCSRIANYWISPLLKIAGPVPGLVWLPIFVVGFSSSRIGSIAALVIAVWFPITLMLSNAIKNTDLEYIEHAQTLGASRLYIVFHVMLPAAVPALANALFMALAGSFGALSAAELAGVKSGLALAVKQMGTIANFGVVFAYVIAMIFIFSTLTALMFAVRNWLLRWQKGLVRW
ncbi:MAG: ABC transporter permease subunit [Coriobacteriales bacterium]|jgi:NitT/TauT family transport system permease protein|nr:ABC transporter permease subunit [Coriobacteriales bacterium]